jgi:hypothetical protein
MFGAGQRIAARHTTCQAAAHTRSGTERRDQLHLGRIGCVSAAPIYATWKGVAGCLSPSPQLSTFPGSSEAVTMALSIICLTSILRSYSLD